MNAQFTPAELVTLAEYAYIDARDMSEDLEFAMPDAEAAWEVISDMGDCIDGIAERPDWADCFTPEPPALFVQVYDALVRAGGAK